MAQATQTTQNGKIKIPVWLATILLIEITIIGASAGILLGIYL